MFKVVKKNLKAKNCKCENNKKSKKYGTTKNVKDIIDK